jgi:Fe-S-cluster-containing dehydrogenase component
MTKSPELPERTEAPADPSRRNFLGALGAGAAALSVSACIRKPVEKILPYAKRPEDLVPGKPMYFATAMHIGPAVLGLLAESHAGRPTKVDGNPNHPMSKGGSHIWAQAAALEVYDIDRAKRPVRRGTEVPMAQVHEHLDKLAKRLGETKGNGFAILTENRPSPTYRKLLKEVLTKYPGTKVYGFDPLGGENAAQGAELVGAGGMVMSHGGNPEVIVTFDSDYLHTDGDVVRNAREFMDGRRVKSPEDSMNRLYAIEPHLTVTGATADHRFRVKSAYVGTLLALLAQKLGQKGKAVKGVPDVKLPEEWSRPEYRSSARTRPVDAQDFIGAIAEDLLSRDPGRTLVVVGERQPPHVHALGHLVNEALGNVGKTVFYIEDDAPEMSTAAALATDIMMGKVRQLVIVGGDPAEDAPADLGLDVLVRQVPLSVHLSLHRNATSEAVSFHIPRSHFLEHWADLRARDGSVAIQQPLIAPLYDSMSELELLSRILGNPNAKDYDLVRDHWKSAGGADFERSWRKWLHSGLVDAPIAKVTPTLTAGNLAEAWPVERPIEGIEVNFIVDFTVLDGRYANSPWLQELPDQITKLTWDNAAIFSPQTAKRLNVSKGELVRVIVGGRQLALTSWIVPGTAEDVVVLPMGYGRKGGHIAMTSGVSVSKMRRSDAPYFTSGGVVERVGQISKISTTQVEGSLHGRPHHREATLEEFAADPHFVDKQELIEAEHIHSMWVEPLKKDGQQWGMSIDLNSCTGCSTCTIACQAENNIPWVGKGQVANGRELHWIRLDRYFEGDDDRIDVRVQPMACVQCETAPCENVCPVAATAHSPDGLNDMAYNRCIGTRYCANNCPYKVRRFNFFHFTKRNDEEYGITLAMQRNPDVTVRFRGVMEKCTYCVQRVNAAKIAAKRDGDGVVKDGTIVPACAQACPTRAIVFGDVNDPQSEVSRLKALPRNYAALSELNTRPRTTYLAKLKNPNPKLGAA